MGTGVGAGVAAWAWAGAGTGVGAGVAAGAGAGAGAGARAGAGVGAGTGAGAGDGAVAVAVAVAVAGDGDGAKATMASAAATSVNDTNALRVARVSPGAAADSSSSIVNRPGRRNRNALTPCFTSAGLLTQSFSAPRNVRGFFTRYAARRARQKTSSEHHKAHSKKKPKW